MTTNHQDSNLKNLMSPRRAGTFFAPFRFRNANPEGFDCKMGVWIGAIEEWAVIERKICFSLKDIRAAFISENGIKPDKECIRLVFSEMKRKSKLVQASSLKTSTLWSCSSTNTNLPLLDNYIDSRGWLSWGVKTLVYNPTVWAVSAISSKNDQPYSDLTDMSISDTTKFICTKSLKELSQNLLSEMTRIAKAEKQFCFEWPHLLELISPIMNTIIDATDGKELLEMLDILIEYLAVNKHISIQLDDDTKLVKIANIDSSTDDDVTITKKDVAIARLLRAKELLTSDADRYHDQAQRAKVNALDSYKRKELAKAKSLFRSHKRLVAYAEQKEAQLTNVEIMLDQLDNTESNVMILQAYKTGAEALKAANTNLDNNVTILDDVYDATAEANQINQEMNEMLKEISHISQGNLNNSELEAELEEYMNGTGVLDKTTTNDQLDHTVKENDDEMLKDLRDKLDNLEVCQHDVRIPDKKETMPMTSTPAT